MTQNGGIICSLCFNLFLASSTSFMPHHYLKFDTHKCLTVVSTRWRFRATSYMRAVILVRSEEHTSELQSLRHLVCHLLLEKKQIYTTAARHIRHRHITLHTTAARDLD